MSSSQALKNVAQSRVARENKNTQYFPCSSREVILCISLATQLQNYGEVLDLVTIYRITDTLTHRHLHIYHFLE